MDDSSVSSGQRGSHLPVPAASYRDPEIDRLEKVRLWPHVWQMACREAELKVPGDFVTYDILDDSILIIRTGLGDDAITALYNVCQHRGRRLRDEPRGRLGRAIVCRFHGWQYSLAGDLTRAHFEEDWQACPEFDKSRLSVPKVKLSRWGGWIWINQDEHAEPLEQWLGDVPRFLDPFSPQTMRPLWWKTIVAPANWKILVEAFIEAYHSGFTHVSGINYRAARMPGAVCGNHAMIYGEPGPFTEYRAVDGKWVTPQTLQENLWTNFAHLYHTLGAMTLAPGMAAYERLRGLPDNTSPEEVIAKLFAYHREELEKRGVAWPEALTPEAWVAAGLDWHIFPNSIVLPTIDGALWYRMRPNGGAHDSCLVDIWSFGRFAPGAEPDAPQQIFDGFAAFKGQCAFLEEDFSNIEAVSRGVKSRGFHGAMLNPVQEIAVLHFHEMLAKYLHRPDGEEESR